MRRRTLGTAGWGVADQVASSVSNFAVLVIIARAVGPVELGVFAIFTAGYVTATYINESLVSEPFVVRHTGPCDAVWKAHVAAAAGCSLVFGSAGSVVLGVAALLSHGSAQSLLVIAAVCAPGLLLQDTLRFAFFAAGRQRTAFLNDLAWVVLQFGGFLALQPLGQARGVAPLTAAWAVAGALCGALGLWQARVIPRPRLARRWLRDHHDLWRFILLERLSGQGAMYLSLIGIGAVAGLSAVAAVRAAQALFGPLYIVGNATRIVLLPWLVTGTPQRRRHQVHLFAFGLSCAAGLWGVAATLLPAHIGVGLFGATWPLVAPLLGILALDRMAGSLAEAWRVGLLSAASVKRSLAARAVVAVSLVIGTTIGAALHGALGAVIAGAVVMPIGAALFGRQFMIATRTPAPAARAGLVEPAGATNP